MTKKKSFNQSKMWQISIPIVVSIIATQLADRLLVESSINPISPNPLVQKVIIIFAYVAFLPTVIVFVLVLFAKIFKIKYP